jgi:hypothetical protein
MIKRLWPTCLAFVFLSGAVVNAQPSAGGWSVSFPCGDTPCLATVMNDEGAVAGMLGVGGPLFAAFPGEQLVQIARDGWVNAINNAGIVVGYSGFEAFVWLPQPPILINLNSIFAWASGTAISINDRGEILGKGIPPVTDKRFADLNQVDVSQINNAGQITGTYLDSNNNRVGFLYTPGLPRVEFPDGGSPSRLNNKGQVLLLFAQPGEGQDQPAPAFSTSLYTAGLGFTPVFKATLAPAGLNDAGYVLGNPTYVFGNSSPTVWTSTGSTPLQSVLPSDSGLTVWNTQAVNNHGQILAWVSLPAPATGFTSVILTPSSSRIRFGISPIRRIPRRPGAGSGCSTLTLNGQSVC